MPARPLVPIALATLALAAAGCGGDGGGGDGKDKREIVRTIERAFTSDDHEMVCEKLISQRFVERVYDTAARCVSVQDDDEKPPSDVPVSDVTIDGDAATARAKFVGGDTDGAAGTIELRKEDGGWRIDDLGTDLLRSVFTTGIDASFGEENEAFREPKIRACVRRALTELPDDRLRSLAYDAVGERKGANERLGRVLTPCLSISGSGRSGDRSFVRDKFEEGIRDGARRNGVPPATVNCIIRELRSSISDEEIGALAASGGELTPKAQRAVARAFSACGVRSDDGTT